MATAPPVGVDGRAVDAPTEPPADWLTRPAVQAAVRAARAHWAARDPGYEEEVRVLAVADGAFTAPDADEAAIPHPVAPVPSEGRRGRGRGRGEVEGEDVRRGLGATRPRVQEGVRPPAAAPSGAAGVFR